MHWNHCSTSPWPGSVGSCTRGNLHPVLIPDAHLSRRRLLHMAGAAGVAGVVGVAGTRGTAGATPPTASAALLCRDAWGARPPTPGGRPHTITRMTIHHTEVVLGDNSIIASRLRQHQRYHQIDRGWVDIAYHAGVDRDGNIFELRTPAIAGDTATDYDTTGHFLVVCEGDFNVEPISEAQLNGAALAFAWAAQEFGVTSDTLASHRQVATGTSCPGANLQSHVASGDLQGRIDDLLTGGPVTLQSVCGPQAAAVVAAIEAGV